MFTLTSKVGYIKMLSTIFVPWFRQYLGLFREEVLAQAQFLRWDGHNVSKVTKEPSLEKPLKLNNQLQLRQVHDSLV